jgi:hypothetical protein
LLVLIARVSPIIVPMKTVLGAAAAMAGLAASATAARWTNSRECRVLPGDANWPDAAAWAALNETVNGRLVATVPIGHVCHDPTYDADACAALQQSWTKPVTQSVAPYRAACMSRTCG